MRNIAFVLPLLIASGALCQTPAKDNDALQALVGEVRQLRQAIEAQTLVSQRVQIALYTLQMQDAVVARDAQVLDEARKKCRADENNKQTMERTIQDMEASLVSGNPADPREKAARVQQVSDLKIQIEARGADVRTCQIAESDATVRLSRDQSRLTELRDRIEAIDKGLERLGANGK